MLTQSIDWAVAENSRQGSKYYNKLDTTKVMVAGFSRRPGGVRRLQRPARHHDRHLQQRLVERRRRLPAQGLTKPIAYFIGGPSDIAYPNAMDDWGKLPAGLPAFMGNLNVGHGGTYDQPNGGEFGRVAVLYLKWRLKGDATAGGNFVGADCGLCRSQWTRPAEEPDARRHRATHHAATHHTRTTAPPRRPLAGPRLHRGLCRSGPVERRNRRQRHRRAGTTALTGWRVTLNLPSGASVSSVWNGVASGTSGTITVANQSYNGRLAAGQAASFGFQGTGSGSGTTTTCTGS